MAVRLRVGDGGQPGLARAGEWDARAVEQVLSRQQLQVRETINIFEPYSTSVRRSSNGGRRSRSEEKVHSPTRDPGSYGDWRAPGQRAHTEMADFKNRGFQVSCDWRRAGHVTAVLTSDWLQLLPSKLPPGGQQGNTAWSARYKSSEALPNLEGSSITAIKKENNVKSKRQVHLLSWIYFHIISSYFVMNCLKVFC